MIIYNSNKEFIGIDESDLNELGFKNLADLQSQAADFADLFVKTPGHVHNFKDIHWIDFVLYAKKPQDSKAIIHANNNNFKVNLEVKSIYLVDDPSSKAFSIRLNNIRSLSSDENTGIISELESRISPTPLVTPIKETLIDDFETDLNDSVDEAYSVEDEGLDSYETIELIDENEDNIQIEQDDTETNEEFMFDPQTTAEALEMPVALIEEFIEDFIAQAKEFKEPLYNAAAQNDMVEIQSYSHKLKGVAANLRVNDALEILTKINKAKDFTTTKKDIDSFYRIISKLSGEKIEIEKASIEEEPEKKALEGISISEDDELLEIIEDDDSIEIKLDDEDEELIISDDFDILDEAMNEMIQENDLNDEDDDFVLEVKDEEYNRASAASEIGIDEDSFNELFSDYIDESQNLISSIEEAIDNDNVDAWREAAIKLKGMSDNMRINSFITDLKVLITTKHASDAKNALRNIQTIMFKILETKD